MNKLYQPIQINGVTLKNRMVMSPMSIGYTENGYVSDRMIRYFEERAKGGVGLIVFANCQWDRVRYDVNQGALLFEEKYVPKLSELTETVHKHDCKIFAQLMHQGRYAKSEFHNGQQSVAPSVTTTPYNHFEVPRELTTDEVKEFVKWQAYSAGLAKKAGFDGVEVETNSGYLHGQFFSPLTNLRTDEYGGDIVGRTRFMVETLQAIRDEVGPDYPVTMRISGNDYKPGSCDSNDIADICELLDKTGLLDGISVAAGWHESSVPLITMELPNGTYAYLGRGIKQRVNCIVMQGMRMNVDKAEELVERGDVDMAVMGRPFLADPYLASKAASGHKELIRPCIGCNAGCIDMTIKGKPAGCIGNYECGNEIVLQDSNGKLPTEVKSSAPERILVIGAGPSGMEFARVASLRGHKVTIWEARDRTRGISKFAATPPRRQDISRLIFWMESECRRLGVEIVLNKKATAEEIAAAAKNYDRVVLACGSKQFAPRIPTDPAAKVVSAWDVLDGKAGTIGKNVVIVGGGDVGVETAMFIGEIGTLTPEELRFMMIWRPESDEKVHELLNKGYHNVSVVEMNSKFAPDINPGCRWSIIARTKQLGVNMMKETKVVEITASGVVVENAEGQKELPADTVVMAAGAVPNNDLAAELETLGVKANIIGDAVKVARIKEAVASAYQLAVSI